MNLIDNYLSTKVTDKLQLKELERIRQIALAVLPGAEETISYNMPTIKYHSQPIIGFDAHKNHIGIYPYSGSVISKIKELADYQTSLGAIRESLDNPLPRSLIEQIITVRLAQLGLKPEST